MKRRASIFGTLAVMAILAFNPAPVCRMVDSARSFQRTFRDLQTAGALNPVESLVFSLVLSNTKISPRGTDTQLPQVPPT